MGTPFVKRRTAVKLTICPSEVTIFLTSVKWRRPLVCVTQLLSSLLSLLRHHTLHSEMDTLSVVSCQAHCLFI
jgi:hypothetical protein